MLSKSQINMSAMSQSAIKQRDRNYGIHIKKIEQIISKESRIKLIKQDHHKMIDVLQKSKNIARKFKMQQDIKHLMTENTKLVCALIDIKLKPRMVSEWKKLNEQLEDRRSMTPKRKDRNRQQIHSNNTKIIESFIDKSSSVKKYRKKLKGQISQYLRRRNNLQKIKTVINQPLSTSQRKKLKKINFTYQKRLYTQQQQRNNEQNEFYLLKKR